MGCIVVLLALAIFFAVDCLIVWGILACLAFFGVPILVTFNAVLVGAALLFLIGMVVKGQKD